MKKYFLFSVMVLATLCLGFSSCSDDDEDDGGGNSKVLVGTWKACLDVEENSGERYKWTYVFNSDNTFTRTYPYYAVWEQGKGTYNVSGNKLIIEEKGLYNELNGWISGAQLEHFANTDEYEIQIVDNNTIKLLDKLESVLNVTMTRE